MKKKERFNLLPTKQSSTIHLICAKRDEIHEVHEVKKYVYSTLILNVHLSTHMIDKQPSLWQCPCSTQHTTQMLLF